jgi:oxidase EvaA
MPVAGTSLRDQPAEAENPLGFARISDFHGWFDDRRRVNPYQVEPALLDRLDNWLCEPDTGDVVHRSNKFFAIRGLDVRTDHREVAGWMQPIIDQPEVGILGILTRTFDGVPHYLMQAKLEPDNVNGLQLSPTVQATYSNYTGVHHGAAVPYLDYFVDRRRARVVYDALQSEQGAWFLSKRNRNIIVETSGDVPVRENFCWLSREQLVRLLRSDNLVNMDSRSVLCGLTGETPSRGGAALHSTTQLLSWLTEARSRYRLHRRTVPLAATKGWVRTSAQIAYEDDRFFRIIGVDVRATHREVARWSQPMLAPCRRGLNAFLGRRIADRFHVLAHAHDYIWMTPAQLSGLARYGNVVSVAARSLLTCLTL